MSSTPPTPNEPAAGGAYGAAALGLNITSRFAKFLSGIELAMLPPAAVHEARRAVLDWIGVALAGSQHPTVGKLITAYDQMGSLPVATALGHGGKRLSLPDAAILNGQMGHVLDFDDTHLGGVILHTSTAAMPALLALGEKHGSSGRDLIVALVAAFEAGIRIGRAAPLHHAGGWHLTGTLGTFAAAAGAARLIGLDPAQLACALGIAATQAAGMQQNRGTDCKSLHAGKAAFHGVLAAMLALNGFDSSAEILEGNLGFTRIYSRSQDLAALTADLGECWMITGNGYKPYACGVVLHPLIDAMIEIARKSGAAAPAVDCVEVRVHPDVIRITGVDTPGSGLMAKFSANHAAAVAFVDRAAGVAQFSDERAKDPLLQAVRKRVRIEPTAGFRLDEAAAAVHTTDGARFDAKIEHARGTAANPMSDQDLRAKFAANAGPVVGERRAGEIAELVWRLEDVHDVGELTRSCA